MIIHSLCNGEKKNKDPLSKYCVHIILGTNDYCGMLNSNLIIMRCKHVTRFNVKLAMPNIFDNLIVKNEVLSL